MKLWSDESGSALVYALAPKEKSASRQEPMKEPVGARLREVAQAAPASSARATPHCCFHCSWCNGIIALPHDRLGLVFGGPAIRRFNARSIATVCGSCRHVGGFSLFRGCAGFDTRHKLAPVHAMGTTRLVDLLHCEEETCTAVLPLFVASESALTSEKVQELAKGWEWRGLTCASTHSVHKPEWLTGVGLLSFPAEVK